MSTRWSPAAAHRLEQLAKSGRSAAKIASILSGEGHAMSAATVGRKLRELLGPRRVRGPRNERRRVASEPATKANVGATSPEAPPTAKDRQVDELIAKSRTWRRVEAAIAQALAPYPEAAGAVVRALRSVRL